MADRRLQWNQLNVSAPNTAGLFAASGRALNDAADAAQGILANYESGQQEKADNELLRRIGGLDQDGLRAAFTNGEFDDLNLSEKGRNILNSAMGDRANIAGVNARTANTRATTGINLARESDRNRAADQAYADDQAIRAAAGDIYAAQDFAEQNGNTVGEITQTTNSDLRTLLARTLQAEAGNEGFQGMLDVGSVIRNRAATGRYGEGIEGVIMRPGQFSAWNSVTGYANGEQGQDMSFTPNEEALRAADTILSGQYQDQTGGATHYVNYNVSQPSWFNDGFVRRGNHWFGDGDGAGSVQGNTGNIAGSTGVSYSRKTTSPVQIARDQLIAAGLRPDQIESALSGVTRAANERETELIKLDAQATLDDRLNAARDLITSSAVTSQQDLAQAIFNGPLGAGLGAREQAQLLEAATGLAEAAPGLLAPAGQEETTALNTSADVLVADLANAAASEQSTARLVDDIQIYQGSDDPFGQVISDVGLDTSGERRAGVSDEEYRQWGRDLADEFQVPESVIAAAMRENFVEDPGDDREGSFWWDIDLTQNTPERQFAEDAIRETVERYLDAGAMSQFTERQSGRDRVEQQIQNLLGQQQNLQIRMRKARTPEERRELQAQLSELQLQMSAIRSDNQGLFSRSN